MCLPDAIVSCGSGTTLEDGECVAAAPVTCGAGTSLENGMCVAQVEGITCGAGTILSGDHCVGVESVHLHLPFPSGSAVRISQGAHGQFSHNGAQVHAIDFDVPSGTMVVAAGPGRVVAVREDSNAGCADVSCANDANYVIVDQSDGTRVQYYHFQQNGALVDVGDVLCAGEPIGLSGNTGFSSAPHLHLDVVDLYGYTLPIYFEEVGEMGDGIGFAGIDITSTNAVPATCDIAPPYSVCPADLFAAFGIWLDDPGLPCTTAMFDTDYTFSGHTEGPTANVLFGVYNPASDWSYSCLTADSSGDFSGILRFPTGMFETTGNFVLLAADETCTSYTGWDASVKLFLY